MNKSTIESKQRMSELVHKVHERQRESQRLIELPASPERIELLRRNTSATLSTKLPEDYEVFLGLSDGLDWDGAVLYATARKNETPERPFLEGLIEANQDLRDNLDFIDLLVLGESGMDLYVHDPQNGGFRIVDRVSLDTYESFDSFDDLLAALLRTRL